MGNRKGVNWRRIRPLIPTILLILGLILGLSTVIFGLLPPARPYASPVASPPTVDVGVATPDGIDSTKVPIFNETDFVFEGQSLFLNVTFSKINSTSDILVLLPFRIENVSTPFGYGSSMLNFGWKFAFHQALPVGQNFWFENASFTTNSGYSNQLLNGSLTMKLTLDNDIFSVGPWQRTVRLSLGSNTSPLYALCQRLRSCLSAYSGSGIRRGGASYIEIGFRQNENVGDGTFPTPALIATNSFGRGVAWIFPSSKYFHDLQLSIIGNDFVWAYPIPQILQPVFMSVGFVTSKHVSQSYSRT